MPVENVINAFLSEQGLKLVLSDDNNRVVLAFYNSNYYGGFCCLLYPFIYEMWINANTKIKKIRVQCKYRNGWSCSYVWIILGVNRELQVNIDNTLAR